MKVHDLESGRVSFSINESGGQSCITIGISDCSKYVGGSRGEIPGLLEWQFEILSPSGYELES